MKEERIDSETTDGQALVAPIDGEELTDDELDYVVGGLARPWTTGLPKPGAEDLEP